MLGFASANPAICATAAAENKSANMSVTANPAFLMIAPSNNTLNQTLTFTAQRTQLNACVS